MLQLFFVCFFSLQFLQCSEIQEIEGVRYYDPEDDNQNLNDYKRLFPNPHDTSNYFTQQEPGFLTIEDSFDQIIEESGKKDLTAEQKFLIIMRRIINPTQEDMEKEKQEMEEEREAYIQSLKPYDQELGQEYYEEKEWIRKLRRIVSGTVDDQLNDADSSDDEEDEYHFDMSLDQWDCKQEENARLKKTNPTRKRKVHKNRREKLALLKRAIDN